MQILYQVTIILFSSIIALYLSKKGGIPVVVGQIIMGILLSPSLLNLVQTNHTLEIFSEIGVILLMFLAGLESSLGSIKKQVKPAIGIAVSGVLVPLLSFFLVLYFVSGQALLTSIFYGIVFAATSVSITIEVLQEYGYLKSKAGATILGAAVIDDILSVLLLSFFVLSISKQGSFFTSILLDSLFFIFLAIMFKVIPWFWSTCLKKVHGSILTTFALVLCFSFSLIANKLGLSTVLGAFFAGLILGQLPEVSVIEKPIHTLANQFFIPIFFVSISLSVGFSSLFSTPIRILLLTLLAILSKYLPAYLSSSLHDFSKKDSKIIGSSMVSRGEMALIIAQIGYAQAIISKENYSELVLVIILSTLIAPLLIKQAIQSKKDS